MLDARPMLATPWRQPFDHPDWWFEVKWDGYRVLMHTEPGRVRLVSRRGNDLTPSFPEISGPNEDRRLVLDGEIIVFGDDGLPSFHAMQQRNGLAGSVARDMATRRPATVVVFDVLWDGVDITGEPFERRRDELEAIDLGTAVSTQLVKADGLALWKVVGEKGLEGIVAKRAGSVYRPGVRSADWRKIARRLTLNAVIGGYLPGDGSRSGEFGSVLVGLYDHGNLRYIGAVGSGFDRSDLHHMKWALDELATDECPFLDPSIIPRNAVWVRPGLTIVVEYKEITPDGRMRAPVFKGVSDRAPSEVTVGAELGVSPPPTPIGEK